MLMADKSQCVIFGLINDFYFGKNLTNFRFVQAACLEQCSLNMIVSLRQQPGVNSTGHTVMQAWLHSSWQPVFSTRCVPGRSVGNDIYLGRTGLVRLIGVTATI